MLMPTSQFLGQVWEFPICGSAPAQHNQDSSDFGSLSTYFSCPPSCSWYHFPTAMRSWDWSVHLPCLEPERRGVLGAVGSVLYKPRAAPWCCSGKGEVEGSQLLPPAGFLLSLQVVWWGRWHQTSLWNSVHFLLAGSWGQSELCVPSVPFQGVPVPAFSGVAMSAQLFGWLLPSNPDWRKGFNPAWALSLFTPELPKVLTINFLLFLRCKGLPWALSVQ